MIITPNWVFYSVECLYFVHCNKSADVSSEYTSICTCKTHIQRLVVVQHLLRCYQKRQVWWIFYQQVIEIVWKRELCIPSEQAPLVAQLVASVSTSLPCWGLLLPGINPETFALQISSRSESSWYLVGSLEIYSKDTNQIEMHERLHYSEIVIFTDWDNMLHTPSFCKMIISRLHVNSWFNDVIIRTVYESVYPSTTSDATGGIGLLKLGVDRIINCSDYDWRH